MIDLKSIAKDAAERVHKNGGCVPQMAFAPILFALQDALSTTPARAEAQDEGALSILDCLLDHSGARGSFDAMRHGDAVKAAEAFLNSARSPGHTDLMVTPESIDAFVEHNSPAQDEGAAGELVKELRLAACGLFTLKNETGDYGYFDSIADRIEALARAHPSPTPAADADRVWMPEKWFEVAEYAAERGLTIHESKMRLEEFQRVVTPQAIAALKSEGK